MLLVGVLMVVVVVTVSVGSEGTVVVVTIKLSVVEGVSSNII